MMQATKQLIQTDSKSQRPDQHQLSTNESFEVLMDETQGFASLVARRSFEPGDIVSPFYLRNVSDIPSDDSIQVDETSHIILYPCQLQYINHSCDPNVFFDTQFGDIICIAPIQVGERITIFYPSTEWDMSNSVECTCGSDRCLGTIRGAKYLSPDVLNQYELARHIKTLKQL